MRTGMTNINAAGGKGADFLIVDINYFPGYEKLPNHAEMMVTFLQSLLAHRYQETAVDACVPVQES